MAGSVDAPGRGAPGGDPGGWDALVAEAIAGDRDRLVGFFVRRTGDPVLAEDLAHETLVRFAGATERFDRDRPVWPYLKTVADNLLIDVTRGEARLVAMDTEQAFADEPCGGEPLEDRVVLRSLLDAAMEGLSQSQRVAFELRCEWGWDVADAAAYLELNANAFRQLLFRARSNLRKALEKSGAVVPGLALPPVGLGLRAWLRSVSVRVREFTQAPTPATALGVEGLASMVIATTLGVAVAVGLPASAAESKAVSPAAVADAQVASQDMAPSTAPAAPSGGGAAIEAAPPVTADVDEEPATAAKPPSDAGRTTVIETPDAVPNSDGHVTAGNEEDQEKFVVSHDIESRTGVETVESDGDAFAVQCGSAEGEILCALSDS